MNKNSTTNKDKRLKEILTEYIDGVFSRRLSKKTSLYIGHEELSMLSLNIRRTYPEIYTKLQNEEKSNFFTKMLLKTKELLERRSGRLLFLTLRHGNYVIIDSWQATIKDWEIESKHRDKDFNVIKEAYFDAKDKIPGIKSVEDFIVLIKAIDIKQLETVFSKRVLMKVKSLSGL